MKTTSTLCLGYSREQYPYYSDLESHVNNLQKTIPTMVQIGIKNYIKKYADNTKALLNYVYFETSPMQNANPREYLDFSSLLIEEKQESTIFARLSRNKEKKAREAIKRIKENMKAKSKKLRLDAKHFDSDYIEGMKIINEEGNNEETVEAAGYASIKIHLKCLKKPYAHCTMY